MKYLIIALVFLVGCNGAESKYVDPAKGVTFHNRGIDDVKFYQSANFNGQIDFIDDNSWVFTSHTNSLCFDKTNSSCRKVIASYQEGETVASRVTKIEFDLSVADINLDDSPDWVIVYQDWVRIDPNDTNGNHPITTLKLKVFNGNLNICHYDNSWQWGYDHGDNRDGSAIDVDHTLHQENTKRGCAAIYPNTTNKIKLLNFDSGFIQLYVDDDLISHVGYQTKSPTENHTVLFGQYWSKGYNKENDPLKRIVIRIDEFKISKGVNL